MPFKIFGSDTKLVCGLALFPIFFMLSCNQQMAEVIDLNSSNGQRKTKCVAPSHISSEPKTIEEAVDLINALPKPVDVTCFLQSLKRPLKVNMTDNLFSAQPAEGRESPRIFILMDQLVISVVPDGIGSEMIEFSQLTSDTRSIKGELHLPIEDEITYAAPYQIPRIGSLTTCGICHRGESRYPGIDYAEAFESEALKPTPSSQVTVDFLENEYRLCNKTQNPKRCNILDALFGHGDVQDHDFPEDMPVAGS